MKAAITPNYGPASILTVKEVATIEPGPNEVLVEVHATPVTAGDRRLRAADFPGVSAIAGRLMLGVFAPRATVQGSVFAGRVVAVGAEVTRFQIGDDVFGGVDNGAYAERVAVREDGAIARMPTNITYEEAADAPYGGVTALRFLRNLGRVQPGEHVLVLGASGGVGRYAVQIAKHFGATVTGVCSADHAEMVRDLGADHVIDYRSEDFRKNGVKYDVIFDIADAATFAGSRDSLAPKGRYLTVFMTLRALMWMAITAMSDGQKAASGVALSSRQDVEELSELLGNGTIRATVARTYALEDIAAAHSAAEHITHGTMIVTPVVDVAHRIDLAA